MSAPPPPHSAHTDRNLLFGVLALQAELLSNDQFAEACAAWTTRKHQPLAELLIERGWITPGDREEIERLLLRKLKKHGGDVRRTLGDAAGPGVRDVLRDVPDPEISKSLSSLPPATGY